jgi:hypothetical protein
MSQQESVVSKLLAPYGSAQLVALGTKAGDGKGFKSPMPSMGVEVIRLVSKVGGQQQLPPGDGKGFDLRAPGLRVLRRRSAT